MLTPEIRDRLFPFIGGIAKENQMKLLAVGGVYDHVHLLLSLPTTISVSKAMQMIKAGSSKFIRESFKSASKFEWQEGYGAFSISTSQKQETIHYILNQEGHHKKRSFQDEFVAFLKVHSIQYDERYVWG